MISSAPPDSLGEFSCLAKNTQGSDSVVMTVLEETEIIVTTPPRSVVRAPGQTARLRCAGHSSVGEVRYQWWKGNRRVEEVDLMKDRLSVMTTGGQSDLVISQVHRDDGGVYVCELSNQHGHHQTVQAVLSVLEDPATVVFTPSRLDLRQGGISLLSLIKNRLPPYLP